MGDNAEHRRGPRSGSSGADSGAVNGPLTQTDVKASPARFNGQTPE